MGLKLLKLLEVVLPVSTFDKSLDLCHVESRGLRVISWVKISALTHLLQNFYLWVLYFLKCFFFNAPLRFFNIIGGRFNLLWWRLNPISFGLKTVHQNKWLWIQHRLVKLEPHYFFAISFNFLWLDGTFSKRLHFLSWFVSSIIDQEPRINHTETPWFNRNWWLAIKV
jgi:hypothetical protein